MGNILKALWAYRGFIIGTVKREFQNKYRNSVLGATWMVLNPLAMILIYTVIFSQVLSAKTPGMNSAFAYSINLCAGMLTWALFAEIVNRAQVTFIENANLLKKLSFPRLCLPVTVVATAILNFTIIFGLFSVYLVISGNFPGIVFLAVFPVLAILIVFSIGLGISLGVLNVFFRDVGHLFTIFVPFWFWLTPIVYPVSILPQKMQTLISYNPMATLINAFQDILVNGQWPSWQSLMPVTLLAVALCFIGIRLFRKHAGEMVDEL